MGGQLVTAVLSILLGLVVVSAITALTGYFANFMVEVSREHSDQLDAPGEKSGTDEQPKTDPET